MSSGCDMFIGIKKTAFQRIRQLLVILTDFPLWRNRIRENIIITIQLWGTVLINIIIRQSNDLSSYNASTVKMPTQSDCSGVNIRFKSIVVILQRNWYMEILVLIRVNRERISHCASICFGRYLSVLRHGIRL